MVHGRVVKKSASTTVAGHSRTAGRKATTKTSSSQHSAGTADQSTSTPKASHTTQGNKRPVCLGCGVVISDDTKALQCDNCVGDSAWKCTECLNITSEMYDILMADDGPDLKWLCDACDHSAASQAVSANNLDKLEEIISSIAKLMVKLCAIESSLAGKADVEEVNHLKERLNTVEQRLFHMDQDIEACKSCKKLDDRKVIDCVEKVISERANDSKTEEAEIEKRKTNLIIHGLPESSADEFEERKADDEGQIAVMMTELKCDNVEVVQAIRLGSRQQAAASNGALGKPRPVKLVLKTEEQKYDVLRNSKNLRWMEDGGWKNVFIHADLTVKQREVRRALVAELKLRKENGEMDLIIVNGKIVRKR